MYNKEMSKARFYLGSAIYYMKKASATDVANTIAGVVLMSAVFGGLCFLCGLVG